MRRWVCLVAGAAALAAVLAGCVRARKPGAQPGAPTQGVPSVEQPSAEPAPPPAPPSDILRYVPGRARVFARGDSQELVLSWVPVGVTLDTARGQVLHGLLLDMEALGSEELLPPLTRLAVVSATPWQKVEGSYRRSYVVKAAAGEKQLEGTVDSSSCLLVLAEAGGISAGFLERRIDIGGGDAEYNILGLVAGGIATLVDTSAWVFPDTFHPSGVRGVTVSDLNGDGSPEVAVQVQTIVSLNYLGATPLTWECWLAWRAGAWAPLFQYNESFATDEGSSYAATRRLVDADGDGMLETVRVTTAMEEASEEREFTNTIVSFYLWDGARYQKQASEELPRQATVVSEQATLFADVSIESGAVADLARGALLYVFDRNDGTPRWYRAVSREGAEGWIAAADVELSWLDPLKVNREVFLSQ